MKNSRFTLVELLVVVAIIGTLASMILPALGRAREKSKQAGCKSNLKNIGTSVSIYYSDGIQMAFEDNWIDENSPISFEAMILSCPVKGTIPYIIHLDSVAGSLYTGKATSGLAQDGLNPHNDGSSFTVYQDGSVSKD